MMETLAGRQYNSTRTDGERDVKSTNHVEYDIRRLSRARLPIDTTELARFLIGKTIVRTIGRRRMSGRIVETEAYPPGDSSGYGYRGETARNRVMFLGRGFAHVYFIYGVSYTLNVTSEKPGVGAGVLIRAMEPLEGIDRMERLRKTDKLIELARGPGRLAAALQIDLRLDGVDLCAYGPLWLGTAARKTGQIGTSIRIGISREVDKLRRFFEVGSHYVSGPRTLSKA